MDNQDNPSDATSSQVIYHLVQHGLWEKASTSGQTYFPPTYDQDGFIHATANPSLLLNVANHFYQDVPGEWLCLEMTVDGLNKTGVQVIFEATAPVGDKAADFDGTHDEKFPHIYGGIDPSVVVAEHPVIRDAEGRFLSIKGISE